jgi:OTU domain-containing protein 3
MELTAFAHMTGRDVKVVQPGLVYVIEANVFGDSHDPPPPLDTNTLTDDAPMNSREARKLRRDRVKAEKMRARAAEEAAVVAAGDDEEENAPLGPVYVA